MERGKCQFWAFDRNSRQWACWNFKVLGPIPLIIFHFWALAHFSQKFCRGARWALAHFSWKKKIGVYIWCILLYMTYIRSVLDFWILYFIWITYSRASICIFQVTSTYFVPVLFLLLYRCINCVYQCIRAIFYVCICSLFLNFYSNSTSQIKTLPIDNYPRN